MVNLLKHAEAIAPVIQFSATKTTHHLAGSSREIVKLKLVCSKGSAHVSIYDNADQQAKVDQLKWVLDASLQTNDSDDFVYPLKFERGMYLVCDDGANLDPQVCVSFL